MFFDTKGNELKYGVIFSYISIGIGNIIQILYTPIMLRMLGQSEFGLNNLAGSVVSNLGLLSFGLGSAYMRYYSRYKIKDDNESIAKLNGIYLIVYGVIGVITAIAGGILINKGDMIFGNGLSYNELGKIKILMILMIFNIIISLPASLFTSYLTAHEKFAFQRCMDIFKKVLNPFLTIPLLFMGYKSIALTLVNVILTLITFIINAVYCYKLLEFKFSFKNLDFRLLKEMGYFSFFIFLNMIAEQINLSVDNFILGRYVGTTAIAIYSIGMQLNGYFITFANTISSVFITKVNMIVAKNENKDDEINGLFIKVGRIQFIILSYIFLLFLFCGRYFISIWAGEGYNESYYIALMLMIAIFIDLIQNIGIKILEAENKHKMRSIIFVLISCINLLISIPLAKNYGAIGAAVGTAAAFLLGNGLFMNLYYYKAINIDIYVFWKNIFKFIPGLIIMSVIGMFLNNVIDINTSTEFIIFILIFSVLYLIINWNFCMNSYEKNLIKVMLNKFKFKLKVVNDLN